MKRKSSTTRPSSSRDDIARLEDIPNVGPAVAADLRQLGITSPGELPGRDPYAMYDDLCRLTGQRHDPCLLDTFIAAVRFMAGRAEEAVVEVHGGTETRTGGTQRQEPVTLPGAATPYGAFRGHPCSAKVG